MSVPIRLFAVALACVLAAPAGARLLPLPTPVPAAVDRDEVTARGQALTVRILPNQRWADRTATVGVSSHPAHGTASALDGTLQYTPAPGFVGRDSFHYRVSVPGPRGPAISIARVDVLVGEPLVIRGSVVDGGTSAAVAAQVSGHNFRTVARKGGVYELQVIGLPQDMVTLASSRGPVVLLGLPGSLGRLLGEAGRDRVLTRDENAQVQLSRLSAALAYQLQLANGGAPIAAEAELQQALGVFDAAALLDMAAAIKLVADGSQPLPPGVPDTLALISDADAFQSFVTAVGTSAPEALADAAAATLLDPSVLPRARPDSFFGARSLIHPGVHGNLRFGLVQGERLHLRPAGTGHYQWVAATVDDGAAWTFVGGAMRVVPAVPAVAETIVTLPTGPVRRQSTRELLEYRLVVDGGASGRDVFGSVVHVRTRFPDEPGVPDDVSPWLPKVQVAYREGLAGVPFTAAELPGTRALPRHRPQAFTELPGAGDITGTGYALHHFNGDGTGTVDDGGAFDWDVQADGSLVLLHGDGERMQVRRLLRDGGKGEGVLAAFVLPDGGLKADYGLSTVVDGSLQFTPALLARAWRSAFDLTQPAHDAWSDFRVVLDGPDQTGYQRSITNDTPVERPVGWDIEGGAMVARTWRNQARQLKARCQAGDACVLVSMRRWLPLAASGDRIYVHEELWTLDPDTGALVMHAQRGNFYEREAGIP